MNRLQKKCLIVSASGHGLLLLVLLVGPAFFISRDRIDSSQTINMIAGRVLDNLPSSGGQPNIQEAPPQAQLQPQPQPQPTPVARPEAVKPVEPVKPPALTKQVDQVKPLVKPDAFTPVTHPKPAPAKPVKDEFQFEDRKTPQTNPKPSPIKNSSDSKPAQVADNSAQINAVLGKISGLKSGLATTAKIEFNGTSGDSDALVSNYGDILHSIYDHAWTPASSAVKSAGMIRARITIARNGRVSRSEIISRSGDMGMEKSVQNALDSVTFIEPFPANSKDLERTYIIEFDPLSKLSP